MRGKTGGSGKTGLAKPKATVYTFGHSTRSLQDFVQALKNFKVKVAVDVRRFPGSKKNPQFSREVLGLELPQAGIRYVWLGELLGGYRSGGYRRHMRTKAFREGIRKLVELALKDRTAVFCSEALWFRCHRRFIADRLTRMGFEVVHLYDSKRWSIHKLRRHQSRRP
ncbi:MAG: hypothetical protein AYL30_006600 [Candidatus Hecatellales archaeon B24]|nr:MAG: hypothetical protein AYL30_006600 [Candidatus Hecatellales archaeon B24]